MQVFPKSDQTVLRETFETNLWHFVGELSICSSLWLNKKIKSRFKRNLLPPLVIFFSTDSFFSLSAYEDLQKKNKARNAKTARIANLTGCFIFKIT